MDQKNSFVQSQEKAINCGDHIVSYNALITVTNCYKCANCKFQKKVNAKQKTECFAYCAKNGNDVTHFSENIAEGCPELN